MEFGKQLNRMTSSPDLRRHKRVINTIRKETQKQREILSRRGGVVEAISPATLSRATLRKCRIACRRHSEAV